MKPRHIVVKIVKSNEALLKSFKTHKELYKFAVEKGLTNSALEFFYFKDALFEIGINYYAIKEETKKQMERILEEKKSVLLEKTNETIILYSAASFIEKRFAICDNFLTPIWFGNFLKEPQSYSDACFDSAQKAVYAISEYKKIKKIESIKLKLFVDTEWLKNNYIYKEIDLLLSQKAIKNNIVLDLQTIDSIFNPAKKYTQKPKNGEKTYKELNVLIIG